jgi:hypothetical protein
MEMNNFRDVFLSELAIGFLPLAVLLGFVVYQKKGKFVAHHKFKLIFISAIVAYQIAALFIVGLAIVDEKFIDNLLRAFLVVVVIVTITSLTYGIDRLAGKKNL